MLDPKITKEGNEYYLNWTPDATAEGYGFVTPNGSSRTFDPTVKRTRLGRSLAEPVTATITPLDVIPRESETAKYPAVVVPPVDPPPSGKVLEAYPGGVPKAIDSAKIGDTVMAVGGIHPKLVMQTSKEVTITNDSKSYFKGIDTNGANDYTYLAPTSIIPVEPNDWDVTPFYLHSKSKRIKILGGFKFSGGYDAIKVYGGCEDCIIDDQGKPSLLSGYGGDGIHINQATRLKIKSIKIGAPWQLGATPEHNDGIHAQDFVDLYLGPGVFIEALGPRSDVDSGGMFVRGEPSASGLIVDGVTIHWQIGRGFQLIDIGGRVELIKIAIRDSGIPGDSPPITFEARSSDRFDVYEMVGFTKDDCYWNAGKDRTFFH